MVIFLLKQASGKSAATYFLSGGRFGDNVLAYLHAKWVSYKYKIPLLYCPFEYSDQLVLSDVELIFGDERYKSMKTEVLGRNAKKIDPDKGVLYIVPWAPESLQEYESVDHRSFYFYVNWDDETFLEEIRSLVKPKHQLNLLQLPCDKITVAVHVRKNSNGFDLPASFDVKKQVGFENCFFDDYYPFKCVDDNFYIDGIRKIYDFFKQQPLYVYIFTDDKSPEKIAQKYQQALAHSAISIDYRHENNNHNNYILEDFFSMLLFDCLVRPDSNFSLTASKLGKYKIIISPEGYTRENNHPKIVRAHISMPVAIIQPQCSHQ